MLILCYGITKSGSTLAFELIKGMLESIGHPQIRLPDGAVQPGHPVNFIEPVERQVLRRVLAAVADRWIAAKTHFPISDETFLHLERLHEQDRIRVIASYRDPREIGLSLMDAGVQARAQGLKEFAEFRDWEFTTRIVRRRMGHFQKWAALRGALRLNYDVVAFSPDEAIDKIEEYLGVHCDPKCAKDHAFERAFTQKNKARPNRAVEELSPEQYQALTAAFSEILSAIDDDSLYARLREDVLRRARRERRKSGRSKETTLPTKRIHPR